MAGHREVNEVLEPAREREPQCAQQLFQCAFKLTERLRQIANV